MVGAFIKSFFFILERKVHQFYFYIWAKPLAAGIPLDQVAGSKTGVYTGSFADDYKMMMIRDLEALPKYAATGGAMTLLANRLSWFFKLGGPSVNLDTACSSSMIALDIACQGLRNGESTMVRFWTNLDIA